MSSYFVFGGEPLTLLKIKSIGCYCEDLSAEGHTGFFDEIILYSEVEITLSRYIPRPPDGRQAMTTAVHTREGTV